MFFECVPQWPYLSTEYSDRFVYNDTMRYSF